MKVRRQRQGRGHDRMSLIVAKELLCSSIATTLVDDILELDDDCVEYQERTTCPHCPSDTRMV